jgi:diguanylate cyclase (GGDEF)-like protein
MSTKGKQAELSLVFVDLETLQSINRRTTIDVRDQFLGHVVVAIRKVLRGADDLFRYGNEEFVVLLTQTDAEAATTVARRIAEKISEQTVSALGADDGRIGATIGVATAPADGITVEALVTAARHKERIRTNKPGHQPPSIH